jgi:Fe-S-cluster containining protein
MNNSIQSPQVFHQADNWFSRAQAALLGELPCRLGCHRCCVGLFLITALDAVELRRGLDRLPAETRTGIEARASLQIAEVEEVFPRLRRSPYVDAWTPPELDAVAETFAHMPCPALGLEGECLIYASRPVTCRMMGIPEEDENGVTHGACDVQTSIPLVRLGRLFREEADDLAVREAEAIQAAQKEDHSGMEEDCFLPYGFMRRVGSPSGQGREGYDTFPPPW